MIRIRDLFAVAVLTTVWTTAAAGQDFLEGDKGLPVPARSPAPAPARKARPARAPDPSKPPAPIIVETTVDRTAVWIGEPILYTIQITCPPGTDILAADISQDRLKLTGLDASGSTVRREVSLNGKIVYRAQFRLVTFENEGANVTIESQAVRYYVHTAGQPVETLAPADEVMLPPRAIAVRSTLPNGDLEWLRDTRSVTVLPRALAYATPIGMVAVVLTFVPVSVGLVGFAWRRMPRRTLRSRRETSRLRRQALEEIRVGDAADAGLRRDLFDRLNVLIKERLTDFEIPAPSLSADEIERAIAGRANRLPAGGIVATLRQCERAAYGGSDELPGPEALSAAVDETARLLAARVR